MNISYRSLCNLVFLGVVTLSSSSLSLAQTKTLQTLDVKYDTAWLPISESQLKKSLASAGNSPVTMFQLIRRAVISERQDALYLTLKSLAQPELDAGQIKHPVFVAAYVDSITRTQLANAEERSQSRQWLGKALGVNKYRWFVLLIRAAAEEYDQPPRSMLTSIATLEQAVKLAPQVSFIRSRLGWAYSTMAINDEKNSDKWFQKSLQQYLLASRSKPVSTEPFIGLLSYYKYRYPDAAKTKFYATQVMSLIPPNAHLKPKMRTFFVQYGVTVPKS